jgi:hypothetical protein
MKESYGIMKLLLEKIHYGKYNWNVCGDLKITDLLLGYTKFCCFLSEWDGRDRKHHYNQKQWPKQESFIPGKKNVVNPPLINPEKIYLHSTSNLDSYKISSKQWTKTVLDICI